MHGSPQTDLLPSYPFFLWGQHILHQSPLSSYYTTQLASLLGIWPLIFTINYVFLIFALDYYALERFTWSNCLFPVFCFGYCSLWLDLLATVSFSLLSNKNSVAFSVTFFFFILGSKALEYSNGIFDCQSPTSPFMGSLRALHLVEDLRGLLEMMETDEKEGLRCQIPDSTAETLIEWLQSQMVGVCMLQIPCCESLCFFF